MKACVKRHSGDIELFIVLHFIVLARIEARLVNLIDCVNGKSDKECNYTWNGPSLKDFDFETLRDFDVFGMNAAYRFWEKEKWYPHYYSCLDDVVGISHADEICNLVKNAESLELENFCSGTT